MQSTHRQYTRKWETMNISRVFDNLSYLQITQREMTILNIYFRIRLQAMSICSSAVNKCVPPKKVGATLNWNHGVGQPSQAAAAQRGGKNLMTQTHSRPNWVAGHRVCGWGSKWRRAHQRAHVGVCANVSNQSPSALRRGTQSRGQRGQQSRAVTKLDW